MAHTVQMNVLHSAQRNLMGLFRCSAQNSLLAVSGAGEVLPYDGCQTDYYPRASHNTLHRNSPHIGHRSEMPAL